MRRHNNFKFEITPNASSDGDEVNLHEIYLMYQDGSLTADLSTEELIIIRNKIGAFLDKEKNNGI